MLSKQDWAVAAELFEQCVGGGADVERVLSDPGVSSPIRDEVRRLLKHHELAEEDFLEPIAAVRNLHPPDRLKQGDILAGRFVIQAFIGRGGMGEVYAARHTHSSGPALALKVLRPDLCHAEISKRRFRREWEIASQIVHPNVCKLGELFEASAPPHDANGQPNFLTMEFVKGQTLAVLLRAKGALGMAETAAITQQILAGLSHIHSLGIIHRDLKPSNIMLRHEETQPSGENGVVIMDFGLAKRQIVSSSQQLTGSGDTFGTLAYLSPEQLKGQAATFQSDVYAFGLIAFEMLTGESAFPCETPEAVLARLRRPARPLTKWKAPRLWSTVISACLECNPRYRPRSAVEVREFLSGASGFPVVLYSLVNRRAILTGAAASAASACGVAVWRSQLHASRGMRLLLADIQQRSALESAIGSQLRAALSHSTYFSLWPAEDLSSVWKRMGRAEPAQPTEAEWREIAFREGIRLILFHSNQQEGNGRRVSVRLEQIGENPEDKLGEWSADFHARNEAGLLPTLSEAAKWVRHEIGETNAEIRAANVTPEKVTTPSWRALLEFGSGEGALSVNDYENALLRYESAVRFDPDFSMAWMRKGDVQFRLSNEAEAYAAYNRALECFRTRPLSRREDLRFRSMLMSDVSDYGAAEKLFSEYCHYFPDESYGPFYRALPLLLLGYADEAVGSLKLAMTFRDRRDRAQMQIAWAYVSRGDYAAAQAEIRQLGATYAPGAAFATAVLAYVRGDKDGALSALERTGKEGSLFGASWGRVLRLSVLGENGEWRQAVREAQRNAEADAGAGARVNRNFNLISMAYLLHAGSDTPGALEALRLVDGAALGFMQMRNVGTLYARCGMASKCRELLERVQAKARFPRVEITRLRLRGELELAAGRTTAGLEQMREAAALDVRAFGKEYLAYALWKAGRVDEARAEYEACLRQKSFQLRVAEPEPAGFCIRAANQLQQLTRQG